MANTNAVVILPSGIGDVRMELYEIGGTGMVNTAPSGDTFIEMSGNLASYTGVITEALDGFYQGSFYGPDETLWAKYHVKLEDTTDWYLFGDYNYTTELKLKTFELANPDLFFADIKFVKDSISTISDDYAVCWFKNAATLASGDIVDPAISVYNTVDGAAVFENQTLDYAGTGGSLRFSETTAANHLASGEPYLAIVSGYIESSTREWKKIIGIDELY